MRKTKCDFWKEKTNLWKTECGSKGQLPIGNVQW